MTKFLCLIATEDRLWNMRRAVQSLRETHEGIIDGSCWSVWELNTNPQKISDMLKEAESCDFAVIYFHGGAGTIVNFHEIWAQLTLRMKVYFESSHADEIAELLPQSGLSAKEYQDIRSYFSINSLDNFRSMLLHIAKTHFGANCEVPPPLPLPEDGFYTQNGILSADDGLKLRKQAAAGLKPVVGLILHQTHVTNGNTKHIDAVLDELERLDVIALPMFTRMANDEDEKLGIRHAMERYFTFEGKRLPDVFMVMTGFSLTRMGWPSDGRTEPPESLFASWDVPALQVMVTRFTLEDYENKPQGIDNMSLSMNIFQPELDGQIITVPSAATQLITEEGVTRKIFVPMPDRISRVCELAVNLARLRRMPTHEKKIAILFHTMPGDDRIGCGEGLDTFESVYRIVCRLKEQGIQTDFDFESGQDIANRIRSGLTNDLRWLSPETATERAAAVLEKDQLQKWFGNLSEKVQKELDNTWGSAPGQIMMADGKMLIPGIQNGNIFIGLQPARAFGERAMELYHSTDSTPPYSYIAYYRWLKECFGANAVYHIGTHGSLEWLPGKEAGLSSNCYPDLILESVPNLYPYHIGITGEGIQAKRRSYAVILDHMTPSLDEAEAYEELAVIDEAFKEYHQAKQTRPMQLPKLAKRIFDLAKEAKLTEDLNLTETDFKANPEKTVDTIHVWLGEVKNSVVKDGLHIFGQVPQGKLYDNLLRMLVRVRNGNIPALNDSILTAMGYDAEQVKDNPTMDFDGMSGLSLYDEATSVARRIVLGLANNHYDSHSIASMIERERFVSSTSDLSLVLHFMCEVIKDKVDHITDEMDNLMAGTNGRFVPPSLGGNPTRGNVSILPTGRNFYSTDPRKFPQGRSGELGVVSQTDAVAG